MIEFNPDLQISLQAMTGSFNSGSGTCVISLKIIAEFEKAQHFIGLVMCILNTPVR